MTTTETNERPVAASHRRQLARLNTRARACDRLLADFGRFKQTISTGRGRLAGAHDALFSLAEDAEQRLADAHQAVARLRAALKRPATSDKAIRYLERMVDERLERFGQAVAAFADGLILWKVRARWWLGAGKLVDLRGRRVMVADLATRGEIAWLTPARRGVFDETRKGLHEVAQLRRAYRVTVRALRRYRGPDAEEAKALATTIARSADMLKAAEWALWRILAFAYNRDASDLLVKDVVNRQSPAVFRLDQFSQALGKRFAAWCATHPDFAAA